MFNFDNVDFVDWDQPFVTVYIEFVRKNAQAILDLGEFEALRRWLLSKPECCIMVGINPKTSLKLTRDFYVALGKEKKERNKRRFNS